MNCRTNRSGLLSLLLVASVALSGFAMAEGTKDPAQWTLLIYLDADNDLEEAGVIDFLEMAHVGSNDQVKIVLLFDRIPGKYDTSYGDWGDTRRGVVNKDDTPTASWGESVGEKNMADPQTLVDFVNWGMATYPAARYGLVLWDHGNGWYRRLASAPATEKETFPLKAVCGDETSNNDRLYSRELRAALQTIQGQASTPVFDLIGFDACLMGMVEVAYEVRQFGRVMVGSEETEPGDGWPYDTFLSDLIANPAMDAATLGTAIVDRYYASCNNEETQSAVDLTQLDTVATQLDTFAQALRDSWASNPAACATAARNLRTAIGNAVIAEAHGVYAHGDSHGLAIYFPTGSVSGDYTASSILLPGATRWDEFLADYLSGMAGSWVATARNQTQSYHDPTHIDLYDFCDKLLANVPEDLAVTPLTGFYSSGPSGGPFDPASQVFTLRNTGSQALQWTAATSGQTPTWLDISPAQGSLDSGATATVTVSLTSQANSLAGGQYSATLVFKHATSGVEHNRGAQVAAVSPPRDAVYWFPLFTDPGWTTQGAWAFGVPNGLGELPPAGHTGDSVYGYNLSGDYQDNMTEPRFLQTSPLDCSTYGNVTLSFWRWLGVEQSKYDHATVAVSNDGTTWTTVWENSDVVEDMAWIHCEYDISAVAANQATVYVRWAMGPTDGSITCPGWHIDDVALIGPPGPAVCFADRQTLNFQSDGQFYVGAYNFDTGLWVATTDATGTGSVSYPAVLGSWLGVYLYDYASGAWTEGMYVYRERW